MDKAVWLFQQNEDRYKTISETSHVPAVVIFLIHGRESSWSFVSHLHNGDSLMQRTFHVPKGRLITPDPPYSFEQSASDALTLDGMGRKNWSTLGSTLQAIEMFNGPGYQKFHPTIPSPYLWSYTTVYLRGKYGSDGHWDALLVDQQAGIAAILKRMIYRDIPLPWFNQP